MLFDGERPFDAQQAILAAADEKFGTDVPVVYFIQSGDAGPIKIGFCNKFSGVRSRIRGIQTGCPWPLFVRRIMRATHGMYSEKELHRHFEAYRLSGEWFEAVPELAELANARPSTTGLKSLLDAAFEQGRRYGAEEDLHAFVGRAARDMREKIAAWEEVFAPEDGPAQMAQTRDEFITELLDRRAA
jgi:hypothetical protein